MIFPASVRFWRAIRAVLPGTEAGDALWLKLRHEPREARKRHMTWAVELTDAEWLEVETLMAFPPNDYVAFCVQHHREDVLAQAWRRDNG